ncbi:MAG: hypothetical protein J6031_01295 [Bacteroidales bacterium]|nr:hypothetical protein [Bacteroidales bacterium]
MNDKDRDRSGDGAGPVARIKRKYTYNAEIRFSKFVVLFVCFLSLVSNYTKASRIDDNPRRLKGLSFTIDVGTLSASSAQANFYNGNPRNANTLGRILYSETYGNQIWNNLTNQDLIGSSVANYRQITVAEYGDMYYRLAFQLGIGFRYDFYRSNWGWLARFDYAKLHTSGMVLLNSGHNTAYLTNQNAYVNCPLSGTEERIYIDLGLLHKFELSNGLDLELSLGANVNNTKVESSDIEIGGVIYSILDIWRGESPSSYTSSYEYINQGGIGYGAFASVSMGLTLPVGTAMSIGYILHYNKVNLTGYNSFAFHHAIKLTVALNNFSFFN